MAWLALPLKKGILEDAWVRVRSGISIEVGRCWLVGASPSSFPAYYSLQHACPPSHSKPAQKRERSQLPGSVWGGGPVSPVGCVVLPLCRGDFGRVKEGETRRSRISVGLSLAGWNLPLVLVLPGFLCLQGPCPIGRPPLPGGAFRGRSSSLAGVGGNP